MSSAVIEKPNSVAATSEREIVYVPLGEKSEIKLSVAIAKKFLVTPTRSGAIPTDADITKYLMLCKARELNPWVGDAYCIGYDSKDGPVFSLITSVQALFKRAEMSPDFDGIESGVIVRRKAYKDQPAGPIEERQGDFFVDDEELLGGWARVHRKGISRPFYESVKLSTARRNTSIWNSNAEGMISKVAEAGALRKAFPNQLGGLYLKEEMELRQVNAPAEPKVVTSVANLTDTLLAKQQQQRLAEPEPKPVNQEPEPPVNTSHDSHHIEDAEYSVDDSGDYNNDEPDILGDYQEQIMKCDSLDILKVIEKSISETQTLNATEKKTLSRMVATKARGLAS